MPSLCFLYSFTSTFFCTSVSFIPVFSSFLQFPYICSFLNIIFLVDLGTAAMDQRKSSNLSWLYLRYVVWKCIWFMWYVGHWLKSRFQVILCHSPLNDVSNAGNKYGEHVSCYKAQHLPQSDASAICNMLVRSKHRPGQFFRPYLIQGPVIRQWVSQGPVAHLFHTVQCKLYALL